MADDLGTKTKLVLSLKSDIVELQANVSSHTQQADKVQKRLTQVIPAIDAVKSDCNSEITKMRDDLNEEGQVLTKVVSWIKDKLDAKIDKKLENARGDWLLNVQKDNNEAASRMRKEFNVSFGETKEDWDAKLKQLEQAHAEQRGELKESFDKNAEELKDQLNQGKSEVVNKIQALESDHKDYVQSNFSGVYKDAQVWVAEESEKAASKKALITEERVFQFQSDQNKRLNEDLQKSNEHFRELWKTDLETLRNEEAALWEKKRLALREEERLFREEVKASIFEEIQRFQAGAIAAIRAAQEQLAKTKAHTEAREDSGEKNDDEDGWFAIEKQLSEKQARIEQEKQTKQTLITSDELLKKLDEDEEKSADNKSNLDSEL